MIRLGESRPSLTSHDSSARSKASTAERLPLPPPSPHRLHPRRKQLRHRPPQRLGKLDQLAIADPARATLNLRNGVSLNVPPCQSF